MQYNKFWVALAVPVVIALLQAAGVEVVVAPEVAEQTGALKTLFGPLLTALGVYAVPNRG